MTAEALTGLLEQHVKEVAAFLTNLREAADEEETLRNDGILQEDEAVLERLVAALHCSQTMRASARQYITYAALTGYDWKAELEEWYARGLLPCKDRRGREGAAWKNLNRSYYNPPFFPYLCGARSGGRSGD